MLFQHNILNNEAHLGIWKIEELTEELMENISVRTLSDKRFQSFSNKARICEWLAVRNLLKKMCDSEKQIIYTESGKPLLADASYNISISHTKNYVAILLHKTKNVGIDIEQQGERVLKLKERFMSDTELSNLKPKEMASQALLHWSAKETLFKILPETEFDFREHLHIEPFELKNKGEFEAYETRTPQKQKFNIQYQVFTDFVLTFTVK